MEREDGQEYSFSRERIDLAASEESHSLVAAKGKPSKAILSEDTSKQIQKGLNQYYKFWY